MSRVAVVMGGSSSEREVSIESGRCVAQALTRLGHTVQTLDYDARFLDGIRQFAPEVIFNALHGRGGEDGQIQGILEWLRIPYTGSDVLACAIAMDKHITKKLLAAEGLPTPAWEEFDLRFGAMPLLPGSLNLPLVVKPRDGGSSAGVSIVRTHEDWSRAMIAAADAGLQILAEEYIGGREFSCGVLFDEALPVVEIVSNDEFYSYDAKYKPGGSHHIVPAPIDADLTLRLQMLALSTHRLVGLRDYSRTDILVSKEGRPFILEVNALPGMTPTSLVPDEAKHAGIPFDALVERLLEAALARRAGSVKTVI
jgi:D-alanine-D-alanine ligase